MFYHSSKLQYRVRVDRPDPQFAKFLQQAIGGTEGEMRVALQYFFQAMGARGDKKYRDMLMMTATEELSHIEFLCHAVALNLEGAPATVQEEAAKDPLVHAIMGGANPRHILSSGLSAMPVNSNGIPFDASHVYASGNLAADMMANVTAESFGRVLASRLYNMTDDSGMRDMLSFLIARDTMHQQQWLAVLEDIGGLAKQLPIPDATPAEHENTAHSYYFLNTSLDETTPQGPWTSGPSLDGRAQFTARDRAEPEGEVPSLGKARKHSGAQKAQIG
jgi:Mn-containing catalase